MRGTILAALILAVALPLDVQAQRYRQLGQWRYGHSTDATRSGVT
jgi:hypothetical protein